MSDAENDDTMVLMSQVSRDETLDEINSLLADDGDLRQSVNTDECEVVALPDHSSDFRIFSDDIDLFEVQGGASFNANPFVASLAAMPVPMSVPSAAANAASRNDESEPATDEKKHEERRRTPVRSVRLQKTKPVQTPTSSAPPATATSTTPTPNGTDSPAIVLTPYNAEQLSSSYSPPDGLGKRHTKQMAAARKRMARAQSAAPSTPTPFMPRTAVTASATASASASPMKCGKGVSFSGSIRLVEVHLPTRFSADLAAKSARRSSVKDKSMRPPPPTVPAGLVKHVGDKIPDRIYAKNRSVLTVRLSFDAQLQRAMPCKVYLALRCTDADRYVFSLGGYSMTLIAGHTTPIDMRFYVPAFDPCKGPLGLKRAHLPRFCFDAFLELDGRLIYGGPVWHCSVCMAPIETVSTELSDLDEMQNGQTNLRLSSLQERHFVSDAQNAVWMRIAKTQLRQMKEATRARRKRKRSASQRNSAPKSTRNLANAPPCREPPPMMAYSALDDDTDAPTTTTATATAAATAPLGAMGAAANNGGTAATETTATSRDSPSSQVSASTHILQDCGGTSEDDGDALAPLSQTTPPDSHSNIYAGSGDENCFEPLQKKLKLSSVKKRLALHDKN